MDRALLDAMGLLAQAKIKLDVLVTILVVNQEKSSELTRQLSSGATMSLSESAGGVCTACRFSGPH
jgi:hypothetical protein